MLLKRLRLLSLSLNSIGALTVSPIDGKSAIVETKRDLSLFEVPKVKIHKIFFLSGLGIVSRSLVFLDGFKINRAIVVCWVVLSVVRTNTGWGLGC